MLSLDTIVLEHKSESSFIWLQKSYNQNMEISFPSLISHFEMEILYV